MITAIHNRLRLLLGLASLLSATLLLSSCQTTGAPSGGTARTLPASRMKSAPVVQRNQQIAQEEKGDYYIGRRWFTDGTRYWGFLRRPGETWENAKLVMMNESRLRQPDRLQERPTDGSNKHGFDHNYEYRMWGSYTGAKVYDPNSDLALPEFRLSKYQLLNAKPGFLFYPGEPYQVRSLPPKHPPKP